LPQQDFTLFEMSRDISNGAKIIRETPQRLVQKARTPKRKKIFSRKILLTS